MEENKMKFNERKFNYDNETADMIYEAFLDGLKTVGDRAMRTPFPVVKAAIMVIATSLLASEDVLKVKPGEKEYDSLYDAIRDDLKGAVEIFRFNAEMEKLAKSMEGGEYGN